MSNIHDTLSWKDDPRFSTWQYSRQFSAAGHFNSPYYFIEGRDDEEEPMLCALVYKGRVVELYTLINVFDFEDIEVQDEDPLTGICLEHCCFTLSSDNKHFAFCMFVEGIPYINIDGTMYEIAHSRGEETVYGFPYSIWFSPDSSRLFGCVSNWIPQDIALISRTGGAIIEEETGRGDSEDELVEDSRFEFETIKRCISGYSAPFYLEWKASGKLLTRPGSLVSCVFIDDSRAILAYVNANTGDTHIRVHCFHSISCESILSICEHPSESSDWYYYAFFSVSPCKQYVALSCLGNDGTTFYVLRIKSVPKLATDWPGDIEALCPIVRKNTEVRSIIWHETGIEVQCIINESSSLLFLDFG